MSFPTYTFNESIDFTGQNTEFQFLGVANKGGGWIFVPGNYSSDIRCEDELYQTFTVTL